MEPREIRYVALGDGWKFCLDCLDLVVMDTNECHPLSLNMQEFHEGIEVGDGIVKEEKGTAGIG